MWYGEGKMRDNGKFEMMKQQQITQADRTEQWKSGIIHGLFV
jgi:hypothetical protein